MCHLCTEGREINHKAANNCLYALKGKKRLPDSKTVNQIFFDIFGNEDISIWLGSSITSLDHLKMKLRDIAM